MMSGKHFKIANFVIFQLIWIAAVVFQNAGLWACVTLLVLHFILSPERESDFRLTYKAILLGVALDFTLMQAGVYIFANNAFPLWLVCLWVGFVLTLRHSMAWLANKPLVWQMGFGAIGGTLSYVSGSKLGAVELAYGYFITGGILIVMWGALVPLFFRMIKQRSNHEQMA